MVDDFEGCEFWLPPEFLNDDDFESKPEPKKTNSEVSSLADSLLSSNESESDEDECLTGLTTTITSQNNKGLGLSSSPKSPLCKASGEFARRKMVEESKGILGMEQPGPNFGFPNHQLSYEQLEVVRLRFQELRRQQMINQTHQTIGVNNGERTLMGLPVSAWPPLQRPQPKPQHGTGMGAVYLGTNLGGAKKQCAGTGVFLPRAVPSIGNRRSKPAPPVFVPKRAVQALNLNMDTLGGQNEAHHRPGYNNNGLSADYGTGLKFNDENKTHVMEQRQSISKAEPENQEVIRLPPEWVY